MTPSSGAVSPLAAAQPDAVYFLMFNGWNEELRSNRWHYAQRWARHLPVVLLQPSQVGASRTLRGKVESRIPNTRILMLQSSEDPSSYLGDTLVQLGQVTEDMKRHGIKRPLLWHYNANLMGLYAALPAVGRVLHATENYFHFEGLPEPFLDFHRAAIRISDVVVAVSEGVATSIRANVANAQVSVITNGCDYHVYSRGSPDPAMVERRGGWQRIAIYAGNINSRLDLVLLATCATTYRETLFAFFGPVQGLTFEDSRLWRALLRERNVRYFGAVSADALPNLYSAADVGIIPYKRTRMLVENGFPLKALEMCATGLPVVSTLMRPLQGLIEVLCVAEDCDSFVAALKGLSRAAISEVQQREMREVCQQYDYDKKFELVLNLIEERLGGRPPMQRRLGEVISETLPCLSAELGLGAWKERASICGRLSVRWRQLCRSRIAKGFAELKLVAGDCGRRRLLWAWAKDSGARREVGLSRVLADLLLLGIVGYECGDVWGHGKSVRIIRTYDSSAARFVFRTVDPSGAAMVDVPSLRGISYGDVAGAPPPLNKILWDHSGIGTTVHLRARGARWPIYLGPSGVYEFRAITAVARHRPGAVWRALLRIGLDDVPISAG